MILVLEEPPHLDGLCKVLDKLGHKYQCARGLPHAYRLAAKGVYDAAICGTETGTLGLKTALALAQDNLCRRIIVAVSERSGLVDAACQKLSTHDISVVAITKPYTSDALGDALEKTRRAA